MKKKYSLPEPILNLLTDLKSANNKKDKAMAESILKLSDHFIFSTGDKTPWENKDTFDAYLFYFFPLNYLRWLKVIEQTNRLHFFDGVTELVDFGAGLGTASLALTQTLKSKIKKIHIVEDSDKAINFIKTHQHIFNSELTFEKKFSENNISKEQVLLLSYSLVELESLPQWALNFEKIIIIEPSTQTVGRKLMRLRESLIQNGFSVAAPCTHQSSCPLLEQSKTDWCHDRAEVELPQWMQKIEFYLPMKNKTLTYSYLALQKNNKNTFEVKSSELQSKPFVRVVGDPLFEKGRTRQLVCRNENREYLTQLNREHKGKTWAYDRGDLIQLPDNIEYKNNELRIKN